MHMKELSNSITSDFFNKHGSLRNGLGFEGYNFVNIFPLDITKVLVTTFCRTFLDWWCKLIMMKGDWCGCWIPSSLPYSLLAILHFELWSLCLCCKFMMSLSSVQHQAQWSCGCSFDMRLFSMVEKSQAWQLTCMCCTKSCSEQSLCSVMKLKFETASQAHLGNGKEKRLQIMQQQAIKSPI